MSIHGWMPLEGDVNIALVACHDVYIPPGPAAKSPYFDCPVPLAYFGGTSQHAMSAPSLTVERQRYALAGHDCGPFILHVGPPGDVMMVVHTVMSTRKTSFSKSSVLAGSTPHAAIGPAAPMSTCSDPVESPITLLATFGNSCPVSLTDAEWAAGIIRLGAGMAVRSVTRRAFGRSGATRGGNTHTVFGELLEKVAPGATQSSVRSVVERWAANAGLGAAGGLVVESVAAQVLGEDVVTVSPTVVDVPGFGAVRTPPVTLGRPAYARDTPPNSARAGDDAPRAPFGEVL